VEGRNQYILTAYKCILDDIKFLKGQQWKVTNYTALVYAALLYLDNYIHSGHQLLFLYLTVSALLISLVLMFQLQESLLDTWDRKDKILEAIDDIGLNISELFYTKKNKPSQFYIKWNVFTWLIIIIIIGAILTCGIISMNHGIGWSEMINSFIYLADKLWPIILIIFITHLIIKFKMPRIEIEVEKKELVGQNWTGA